MIYLNYANLKLLQPQIEELARITLILSFTTHIFKVDCLVLKRIRKFASSFNDLTYFWITI